MSWIEDVRTELAALDCGPRRLFVFGTLFGFAALVGGGVRALLQRPPTAPSWGLALAGAMAISVGIVRPALLRGPFRAWMSFAFALGWLSTRILLTLLFLFVVTPLALAARAVGKEFLTRGRPASAQLPSRAARWQESYWEPRSGSRKIDHEKLF